MPTITRSTFLLFFLLGLLLTKVDKRIALIIGVCYRSSPQDPNFPPLTFPHRDALQMKSFLQGAITPWPCLARKKINMM